MTILLVDQMASLALALADRAYVIEGGRIVAQGPATRSRPTRWPRPISARRRCIEGVRQEAAHTP